MSAIEYALAVIVGFLLAVVLYGFTLGSEPDHSPAPARYDVVNV